MQTLERRACGINNRRAFLVHFICVIYLEMTDRDLAAIGLAEDELSMRALTAKTMSVLFGIFISLVFSRIPDSAARHRMNEYTLLFLGCTMLLYQIVRLFVSSAISNHVRQYSYDYWRILMQTLDLLLTAFLFFLTHFISDLFIALWTNMDTTPAESFEISLISLLVVYFILQVDSKPKIDMAAWTNSLKRTSQQV